MRINHREKFVLLGNTGYIGEAFAAELAARGEEVLCLTRANLDYTSFEPLRNCLSEVRPTFLINCAGYTGKPNVDACRLHPAETISGNVTLPNTIANACESAGVKWGHVSSGCIYSGAKIRIPGQPLRVEKHLMLRELQELWQRDRSVIEGFHENDPPNFSFRSPPCSFYSGTKALGEEVLSKRDNVYIWRLRVPFDHIDHPRNYLSKLQTYPRLYDNVNSLSHRGDFVKACLDLWAQRADLGIFNVTNPGFVTTSEVVQSVKRMFKLNRTFEYFKDDAEFHKVAAEPRSSTVLSVDKLAKFNIPMRPVQEAINDSLRRWKEELNHTDLPNIPHFISWATRSFAQRDV